MPEQPYTNREIQEFMRDIKETLARIEAQTTRTNGRVTLLEAWKQYSMGATAILTLVVLPSVGWLYYEVINLISK